MFLFMVGREIYHGPVPEEPPDPLEESIHG
jgi:hypothetical protein